MKAIQITQFGGPDVMQLVDLPDPVPSDAEELIEVSCIGINYADTHQTENSYLSKQTLPLIPGLEVVGKTASGSGVHARAEATAQTRHRGARDLCRGTRLAGANGAAARPSGIHSGSGASPTPGGGSRLEPAPASGCRGAGDLGLCGYFTHARSASLQAKGTLGESGRFLSAWLARGPRGGGAAGR